MAFEVSRLDPHILTARGLFTPEECEEFVRRGEAFGFESAAVTTSKGPRMLTRIRNNDRVVFDDFELAEAVWQRVREIVPPEMDGFPATRLNERWRFYRYDPGQRFKRHRDGRVQLASGEVSRVTFLIYLNAGYEGGETIFSDHTFDDGHSVAEIRVAPEVGMGLFFLHERWHEGTSLVNGRKYVLRTDVMYAGAPESTDGSGHPA